MGIHPSDPLTGLKPGLGGVIDVLSTAGTGRFTGGGTRRVVGCTDATELSGLLLTLLLADTLGPGKRPTLIGTPNGVFL